MTAAAAGPDSRQVQRAGHVLSGAAAAATLFLLAPGNDAVRFVAVQLPAVGVLLLIALLGSLGARAGRPVWSALAGAIAVLASLLQFGQFGRSTNWLGGNGSTAAFLAALGIGFWALWYAGRHRGASHGDPGGGGQGAS